jgi:mono/diheme cytochrome c family protein
MRLIRWTLCTAITWTVLACGDSSQTPTAQPTPPTPPPAAEEPALPPPPPPPPSPAPAAPAAPRAGEPVAATGGDAVARGHEHYKLLCATCHGEDGCTPGPGAAGLDPQPAKHCDGNYMNKLSDDHIFKVIKEGGASVGKSPLMAPWGGTLTDDQIRDVIAFLRSIANPPYHKS